MKAATIEQPRLAVANGMAILLASAGFLAAAEDGHLRQRQNEPADTPCTVLADQRLEEPVRAIVAEFGRLRGVRVEVQVRPGAEVDALVGRGRAGCDVVLSMEAKTDKTPVASLPGAKKVAWKYPSGKPVWAAAVSEHPDASALCRFFGSPKGHRLWSESRSGFTITSGETHAEAFEWVAEHRVRHTYAATAVRMLRECGGIREGVCIDVGCGPGNLAVELAKRSNLTIVGLDIDPDMKPLFEKKVREAGYEDRVRFVVGDAQQMPWPNDYADVIVSRGTLTFIPDIGKCLREVRRVLKPSGVAFLGGRYLYTPQAHKMSTEKLREIVRTSGVAGAEVIDARGQWVKIVGPEAPQAARQVTAGSHRLAHRFVADYATTDGTCLLLCRSDGGMEQALEQGFLEITDLKITALYPSEEPASQARKRIRAANLAGRVTCKVGQVHALPFEEASFDAVAAVGPVLLFGDRETAMREIYRVLRQGGVALIGGQYLHMPASRRVSSDTLRASAANTGIGSICVIDDMGQWVEIRKGTRNRR